VNWRGNVFLLAAVLVGGCIGIALAQVGMVGSHEAVPIARPTLAAHAVRAAPAVSAYALTDADSGPALATTTADLKQLSRDRWQTTVILSQARQCPGPKGDYWLETTSPDGAYRASSVTYAAPGPCRVTVTFDVALSTQQSATLVLDEAGLVSSAQLSLSRDVQMFEKYGFPFIFGGAMVLILLTWIGFSVRINGDGDARVGFFQRQFWRQAIEVSDKDILKVGGISVATILATVIAAAGFADTLFPGVSLGGFVVVSIVSGMIVAAGPGVYNLLYGSWISQNPLYLSDDAISLSSGKAVLIDVPSGAEIGIEEGTSVQVLDAAGIGGTVNARAFTVPAGGQISIDSGESLAIPEGTSSLRLAGGFSAQISRDGGGQLTYGGGTTVILPATITADKAATITYQGLQAYITIPDGPRVIKGTRGKRISKGITRFTLTPSLESARKPTSSMKVVVGTAACTTLGIGVELGLIGVLAVIFSEGGKFARGLAGLLVITVALITLYYSFITIRNAADKS
jgi:hypothetical protein